MKNKMEYKIIWYTMVALSINLLGRILSENLMLPVWCDSVGTFLIAYAAGPVCGGMVGFTTNIIYGMFVEQQLVYALVGALIGVLAGIFAKRKVFETQFMTMTFGMAIAICSSVAATLINILLYDGMPGNMWGDQVVIMCIDKGFPKYAAYALGQFCMEFLDKLLCAWVVFLTIKIRRNIRYAARKKARKALMICMLAAITGTFAQTHVAKAEEENTDYDTYVKVEYGNEEGLLSGEANDIAQTKDGTLWIGTYAGLFKYDGAKFKLFSDVESVKNVKSMYVDEEGRLWVGTNDDGVTIFINDNVMNVIDESTGLPSNTISSIVCDSHGNYYVGTTNGLAVVTLSQGVSVVKTFDVIKNVLRLSADDKGNVVVISERGELYWIKNGELVGLPIAVTDEESFSAVAFTGDDKLLLGTYDNRTLVYDMLTDIPTLIHVASIPGIEGINSFSYTEEEIVFVCSDTGVAIWNKNGYCKKLNTGSFTSSIDNMLFDYQGNLWFSSSRLGLLKMCKTPFFEIFPELGITAVVNSTEKWMGMLYCGTDSGLVIVDEEKNIQVTNELSSLLEGIRIRCVKKDDMGNLWIATSGNGIYRVNVTVKGAYKIENLTEKDGLPGMRFRNICQLMDGRIAAGGDYGLAIISGNVVKKVYSAENGLSNEKSLCLIEFNDALFVGSDGGGIAKIKNGKIEEIISRKDGLSSNVVMRMVYDPVSEGVFIVTSNGLCYMSPEEEVSSLTSFPYSNNYDIICREDGKCWIMSSAGVYVADSSELIENKRKDYILINSKRGFRQSLVANSWVCKDGDLVYLCCDDGVVKVDMTQYDMSVRSYRMMLDGVWIDDERYDINRVDTFKIPADAEKIVFEPMALNYSMNDPYVSVILNGYDTKEKVCLLSELDTCTYIGLPPGKYVFTVAILDGKNGNPKEVASYSIKKEAQMYQNWWFKLYIIIISSLVIIWITWFITRKKTERTLLKQKYELEYARKQIEMGNETILSIARTVDAKDSNTSEHSFRVSEYSVAIAKKLGYSREKCENLRQMAMLHDIGKIGIPDAILNKPGKLTDEEYEIMKTHVIRGGEILKDFTLIDNVSIGALYHHERYDGKGYCHGLKGEEIPLDARIIGIADAFDAMTANRVYRKQLELDEVIKELKRCSGTQFDPKLVDILLHLIDKGVIDVKSLYAKSKEGR